MRRSDLTHSKSLDADRIHKIRVVTIGCASACDRLYSTQPPPCPWKVNREHEISDEHNPRVHTQLPARCGRMTFRPSPVTHCETSRLTTLSLASKARATRSQPMWRHTLPAIMSATGSSSTKAAALTKSDAFHTAGHIVELRARWYWSRAGRTRPSNPLLARPKQCLQLVSATPLDLDVKSSKRRRRGTAP